MLKALFVFDWVHKTDVWWNNLLPTIFIIQFYHFSDCLLHPLLQLWKSQSFFSSQTFVSLSLSLLRKKNPIYKSGISKYVSKYIADWSTTSLTTDRDQYPEMFSWKSRSWLSGCHTNYQTTKPPMTPALPDDMKNREDGRTSYLGFGVAAAILQALLS